MKFLEKPYLPLVITVLLVACLYNAVRPLDRAFFDACTRAGADPRAIPTNGVLVLVDEDSMKAVGEKYGARWPWPRSLFAAMIASLHHAGAAKIVMDFEFLEPSVPEQDDVLEAYAVGCPQVVLGRTHEKLPWFCYDLPESYNRFDMPNRVGLVDIFPDDDGVYRSYPLFATLAIMAPNHSVSGYGDRALLRWYGSVGTTNPVYRIPARQTLSAARFVILGEQLQEQLRAKGVDDANPGNIVSALDALPPLTDAVANSVRGKVVFVGANAAATVDLKPTPLGKIEPQLARGVLEPGILVHFTAWANIERHDFIRPVPKSISAMIGLILAGVLILIGWRQSNAVWMAVVGAVMIGTLLVGSVAAFHANHFVAPSLPVVSVFIALLAGTTHNFWRERKRKREIEAIFGSYVAKAVVDKLVKDPAAIRLGGEKRELTVFFSDLAGFTDLSEKLPPEELVAVVNRYLAAVTDFILDNHGYVDKYIGDAVMGVFGSPEPVENHAAAACRAALAAREWMERAFADAPVKLRARIGLNTGPMIVGNVGSERKKNYTVLGDAVNLASRLEAANKEVGTLILIGEDTERMVRDQFLLRPIARLRVKGKQQPNQVFELVGEPGNASAETKEFVAAYTAAYQNFMKQEFAAARVQFHHARVLRPADRMTQLYLDKATKFEYEKSTPLPPDWDVVELKTK